MTSDNSIVINFSEKIFTIPYPYEEFLMKNMDDRDIPEKCSICGCPMEYF